MEKFITLLWPLLQIPLATHNSVQKLALQLLERLPHTGQQFDIYSLRALAYPLNVLRVHKTLSQQLLPTLGAIAYVIITCSLFYTWLRIYSAKHNTGERIPSATL